MSKRIVTVAPVLALGGVLLATTTAAAPSSAAPAHRAPVVAFNWWHGKQERRAYFGSVRPITLGGRLGEPVTSLRWRTWNQRHAGGLGQIVHMSCQPCHVKVVLSHAKPSPRGRFFNWMTVTYTHPADGTIGLRWSFRQRNWVGR